MKKKLLCMGLAVVFAVSALAFTACGEDKMAELKKQLSALQTTAQTQKEELDSLKKEKEGLQKQVDELNKRNADSQKQIDDNKEQIGKLQKQIRKLQLEKVAGNFCSLEESYEKGFLTRDDILHIAYYSMITLGYDKIPNDNFSEEVKNFKPTELTMPQLSEQERATIIEAYYRHDPKLYAVKDDYEVKVLFYYGQYDGVYAVSMWTDFYGYGDMPHVHYNIDGIKFISSSPGISVFVPIGVPTIEYDFDESNFIVALQPQYSRFRDIRQDVKEKLLQVEGVRDILSFTDFPAEYVTEDGELDRSAAPNLYEFYKNNPFTQGLLVTIEVPGKQNVLDIIKKVKQFDFVYSATPNMITQGLAVAANNPI